MRKNIIKNICILSIFIIISACQKDKISRDFKNEETLYKSDEEFSEEVKNFPYIASDSKRLQIISNYDKLSLTMTKGEVFNILGAPDVEAKIYSKNKEPGFLGWQWVYYLYKTDAWGQNLKKDKELEIFYNRQGRIFWVVPLNIEGLTEKGNPSQEIHEK